VFREGGTKKRYNDLKKRDQADRGIGERRKRDRRGQGVTEKGE
jgi:hypothetical protein